MAYMGRGDFPSIGENNNSNGSNNTVHRGPYFYSRIGYYIPLDNTYVIMQMIVTFIILIVGAITYLLAYKSSITDPIESTKATFTNIYLITMAIYVAMTFLIHYMSKKESTLIKRIIFLFAISAITMFIFGGVKLNLDSTYTQSKFEEIYDTQYGTTTIKDSKNDKKQKISLGLTGVELKTEKEYYVDECMKMYNIFKVKTNLILILHLLLNILLIYQISKISKIEKKKKQLNKDDEILYDEVENIKI